jgi:thiamine biosynthesis lipoprotein
MITAVYRVTAVAALATAGCVPDGGGCLPDGASPTVRVSDARPLMGVAWTITVYAGDRHAGDAAIAAGFAEADRLERVLSDYDADSELSRLSAAAPTPQPVPVGDDLWRLLVRAEEIRSLTDGAFDITVGPLTTLWRQSRRSGKLPRPDKLAAARAAVGGDALRLDPKLRGVSLRRPGMRLDPGGIGMGYAADRVLAVLAALGIDSAMVDASGDVVVSAPPPGTAGWRIAVAGLPGDDAPDAKTLVLSQAAVTTSGDARQAVDIDGRRYSHIVDPRTGIGVSGPAVVTVIAADGATADALATAASVLGPDAAADVIDGVPGCSARFVWQAGDGIEHCTTAGWPAD